MHTEGDRVGWSTASLVRRAPVDPVNSVLPDDGRAWGSEVWSRVSINRRAFLRAAGLGASAAGLAGCGGAQASPVKFPGLARKLSGPLITPDRPGYQLAR